MNRTKNWLDFDLYHNSWDILYYSLNQQLAHDIESFMESNSFFSSIREIIHEKIINEIEF